MRRPTLLLAFALVLLGPAAAQSAILGVIDFESHPAGAIYGSPALPAGSLAFVESGVPFRLKNLALAGGSSSYNRARIVSGPTGQSLEINNVVLFADFATFQGAVSEVTFEYTDLGGLENLRVNGGLLQTGDLASFVSAVAPGVELYVSRVAIAGGVRGKVLLRGGVESFEIGGQEFFIDNIRWSSCR